ncbi:MAG: hypothetical protein JWM61_1143, partial [Micrococcaceae bacterium]|nr:hypothetical protein [Micrococcaceae bacterium]
GIATFNDIIVKNPGRSTLVLSGTGLITSDPSAPFTVN